MVDSANIDEQQISSRRSIRSCRLSTLQSKPSIEKKVDKPQTDEQEIDEEDPPELFQLGDLFWVRVPGNPWWPALIHGAYYENYLHTKVLKTARRRKKRVYFVYFFGPAFEYTWTHATLLIPYCSLSDFIQQAETSVQNATTRSEQEILANRFELKVAANKRAQWDNAIEEADKAFQLTREERTKNFDEILKTILHKAEENKSVRKRNSSATTRSSRRSLSPSVAKTANRSSVKRQKTKITPLSTSTTLLHVGLPILTKREEKRVINNLLTHPKNEQLTFHEAQSFICQLVTEIIKENSHYDMSCVQIEWFYDFLINHPDIISKYSHWFNDDIKPISNDSIYFKQCQIKNMILNSKK